MDRVLVTGFEPFGGREENASWLAARALPERIGGTEVHRVLLPCVFGRAADAAARAVEALDPAVVVALGEHRGAAALEVERGAVDLASTTAPDEAGALPLEVPLAADGPWALASTLPVAACARAAQAAGVPTVLSCSAGLYVCNSVLYGLLDHERRHPGAGRAVGFVHVPATPAQALCDPLVSAVPSMDTALAAAGIKAVIAAALESVRANHQQ